MTNPAERGTEPSREPGAFRRAARKLGKNAIPGAAVLISAGAAVSAWATHDSTPVGDRQPAPVTAEPTTQFQAEQGTTPVDRAVEAVAAAAPTTEVAGPQATDSVTTMVQAAGDVAGGFRIEAPVETTAVPAPARRTTPTATVPADQGAIIYPGEQNPGGHTRTPADNAPTPAETTAATAAPDAIGPNGQPIWTGDAPAPVAPGNVVEGGAFQHPTAPTTIAGSSGA